jgi:hypothetical protein
MNSPSAGPDYRPLLHKQIIVEKKVYNNYNGAKNLPFLTFFWYFRLLLPAKQQIPFLPFVGTIRTQPVIR